MDGKTSFGELFDRVRNGDQEAALLLVLHYGETLRRVVRRLLRWRRLEHTVRESDVMQSAWAVVFERARQRRVDSKADEELLRFLIGIARRKVAKHARYVHQACRDVRRVVDEPVESLDPPDPDTDHPASESEALERFRAALNALPRLHRELVLARQTGAHWEEIAAEWGISPDAARKRYERIIAKLRNELCGSEIPPPQRPPEHES